MSKKTYEALPGVEWVNGKSVPENRELKLTKAEARYDVDHGRIRLKDDDLSVVEDGSGAALPEAEEPQVEREAPAAAESRKGKR